MNRAGFLDSFLWPACMWLTHAFVGVLLFMVPVFIVPPFLEIFEDFSTELPASTQMLIVLSEKLVTYWFVALLFCGLVDAALLFGLSQTPSKLRWLRSLWFNGILVVAALLMFFAMVGLALPFQDLTSGQPSLYLTGTQDTDALLEHVGGLTRLQGASQEHLDNSYLGLGQLRALYLDSSDVTDAELEHLKGLTNLRILGLSGTQITDDGLEHLQGLADLRTLWLHETHVTDEGVKELQQALPNCEIVR